MSSRGDYRRRDRSWERNNRERGDRYSRGARDRAPPRDDSRRRSRSPRRSDRDHDRKDGRRDYPRDRDRDRDRDRRERDDRYNDRDRRERDRDSRDTPRADGERSRGHPEEGMSYPPEEPHRTDVNHRPSVDDSKPSSSKASADGDIMDVEQEEDTAMMAMMGMSGFGSTKGKHVLGNQEGDVEIKKVRTWRQYMNRRGGFNRPLDKIK
ncbi:hypothetical protein FISHEDRAFT_64547 [Fistulina hepatica ATCC 64428]|nr:hypothetical protein FISHEDRAFT_64547 [Fistulina hepatica ATCC 64428]